MKKGLILRIHSIAGLVSGIFILLMSLSGAALVFGDEFDQLQQPSIEGGNSKTISVDAAYRAVQFNYPAAQISHCMLPERNNVPFSFFIHDPSYKQGKKTMQVFLHPRTGKLLGSRGGSDDPGNNFMSWLAKFHNSFHLGKTGEWLLGSFSLVFLLSILSGFVLYRRNILAVLGFNRRVYRWSNLHQVVAVWALLFNLMIAVTGFWMQRYVFKKSFYDNWNYDPVLKSSPAPAYDFDAAYAALRRKYPGFTAAVIYFPQGAGGRTAIYGSRSSNDYIHSKKYADMISVDSTGTPVQTRFIDEISADDRYDIINSQLHMGRFGGLGIKLVYFFFGLTSALLSITGFLLWFRRRKRSSAF